MKVIRLSNSNEVLDELPLLANEVDFVVADGPGSQTETSRALLLCADLAVIPCKASMMEARALSKNTSFVRQAQAIRKGPPEAIVVLSMVGRDYRLTKDMREAALSLNLSLAETPIILRQSIADAPGQAKFCSDMGFASRSAATELDTLFQELFPNVGSKIEPSIRTANSRK